MDLSECVKCQCQCQLRISCVPQGHTWSIMTSQRCSSVSRKLVPSIDALHCSLLCRCCRSAPSCNASVTCTYPLSHTSIGKTRHECCPSIFSLLGGNVISGFNAQTTTCLPTLLQRPDVVRELLSVRTLAKHMAAAAWQGDTELNVCSVGLCFHV